MESRAHLNARLITAEGLDFPGTQKETRDLSLDVINHRGFLLTPCVVFRKRANAKDNAQVFIFGLFCFAFIPCKSGAFSR